VSPQDFSPAPYPDSAENGTGAEYVLAPRRTRERYWRYILLFLLTWLTTCMVGAAMQIAKDIERTLLVLLVVPQSYPPDLNLIGRDIFLTQNVNVAEPFAL